MFAQKRTHSEYENINKHITEEPGSVTGSQSQTARQQELTLQSLHYITDSGSNHIFFTLCFSVAYHLPHAEVKHTHTHTEVKEKGHLSENNNRPV